MISSSVKTQLLRKLLDDEKVFAVGSTRNLREARRDVCGDTGITGADSLSWRTITELHSAYKSRVVDENEEPVRQRQRSGPASASLVSRELALERYRRELISII